MTNQINRRFSAADVYRKADPPPTVSLDVFRSRIRRQQLRAEELAFAVLHDALYLSQSEYKSKYGTRKTYVKYGDITHDLFKLYSAHERPHVAYRTFYQRVKRLEREHLLDEHTLAQASLSSNAEWVTFFGGGRRRRFTYHGDIYPRYVDQSFSSVTSFLRALHRYEDRANIWSRLKAGWDLDDALSEPITALDERTGLIYLATCAPTSKQYVGLTRMTLKQRWRHHIRVAIEAAGQSLIAQAIRQCGAGAFLLQILEAGLNQTELPLREIYWIEKLNTLAPNGLNSLPGGQMGGSYGKRVIYAGEAFSSIEAAADKLSKQTGLPKHVIIRRLQTGQPLPDKPRKKSLHNEAGTNLWRRWKSLLNGLKNGRRQGLVAPAWENYDNFKSDVRQGYDPNLRLVRIDISLPWGPLNFKWVTVQEAIEAVHAKSYVIDGYEYASLNAVARQFGIGRSTLKYRLEKKGLSIAQAVKEALGPTSRKAKQELIVIDDHVFDSQNKAANYAAAKYGLSFNQARDRVRRGVPLAPGCTPVRISAHDCSLRPARIASDETGS